jgi:hypothetical protein
MFVLGCLVQVETAGAGTSAVIPFSPCFSLCSLSPFVSFSSFSFPFDKGLDRVLDTSSNRGRLPGAVPSRATFVQGSTGVFLLLFPRP